MAGANLAVNTPRPGRGTRIESLFLFVLFCLASRVEGEQWALPISFVRHIACDVCLTVWSLIFLFFPDIVCVLTFLGPLISR